MIILDYKDRRPIYEQVAEKLEELIREKTGLWLCAGKEYGGAPDGFLRMNIACPRSRVMDGLERLKRALEEIQDRYRA